MKRIGIYIDEDTGFCNDDGPFRSYQLHAEGDVLLNLLEEATIYEIDQDGGDCRSYSIYNAREEVTLACELSIAQAWVNAYTKK